MRSSDLLHTSLDRRLWGRPGDQSLAWVDPGWGGIHGLDRRLWRRSWVQPLILGEGQSGLGGIHGEVFRRDGRCKKIWKSVPKRLKTGITATAKTDRGIAEVTIFPVAILSTGETTLYGRRICSTSHGPGISIPCIHPLFDIPCEVEYALPLAERIRARRV